MTRTFDLTPFTRSTIGFDRLFDDLNREFANSGTSGYPPYNIVAIDENEYMISLAVAGFGMDNLEITKDGNVLTVEGTAPKGGENVNYLHKGIAGRNFRRQFTLADHVEVESANLELGMLNIYLVRRIPEELQPKRIAITVADSNVIDSK
jgi:molecular chaperone IbpA